jgi:hypothetical protein
MGDWRNNGNQRDNRRNAMAKSSKSGYLSGSSYRANLRSTQVQENPKVTSKGGGNAAEAGFKPSDPRNAQQPAKLYAPDLPSGVMSREESARGNFAGEQVGWVNGKWVGATQPNTDKAGFGALYPPGTASKPSGRTITK